MDMKAPLLAPLSLLLLLFLLSFPTKPSNASSQPHAVLDTDGHNLRTGVRYYILPVVRGQGVLTLGASRSDISLGICPYAVVLDQHEVFNGFPVEFSPADAASGTVRLSTDHNIWFDVAMTCVQSTVWRLDNYNKTMEPSFVVSGGVLGNPGRETISNWFKIEKMDNICKPVFCPTVCNTCTVICGDVGVGGYWEAGMRRLALSDEPLGVIFKKA